MIICDDQQVCVGKTVKRISRGAGSGGPFVIIIFTDGSQLEMAPEGLTDISLSYCAPPESVDVALQRAIDSAEQRRYDALSAPLKARYQKPKGRT